MSVDVLSLWNFQNPEESEQKFLMAIPGATLVDQLILQTQIARTYGLRGNFSQAQKKLADVEPHHALDPEVAVRYHLELGRTLCSAKHKFAEIPKEDVESARQHYMTAFETAQQNKLDYLAIDALHMMTCVDVEPKQQLDWNAKAINYLESSTQPDAKKWEGSLRNNLGYALHLDGRYDDAMDQFQKCLALREEAGNVFGIRVAKWMIAWTLRAKGDLSTALEMQLALEKEWDQEGGSDHYVFEELEALYRAMGDDAKADAYKAKMS